MKKIRISVVLKNGYSKRIIEKLNNAKGNLENCFVPNKFHFVTTVLFIVFNKTTIDLKCIAEDNFEFFVRIPNSQISFIQQEKFY